MGGSRVIVLYCILSCILYPYRPSCSYQWMAGSTVIIVLYFIPLSSMLQLPVNGRIKEDFFPVFFTIVSCQWMAGSWGYCVVLYCISLYSMLQLPVDGRILRILCCPVYYILVFYVTATSGWQDLGEIVLSCILYPCTLCYSYQWMAGSWGDCVAQRAADGCGPGIQGRPVICIRVKGQSMTFKTVQRSFNVIKFVC